MAAREHLVVYRLSQLLSRTRAMDTQVIAMAVVVNSLRLLAPVRAMVEQHQPCTTHTAVVNQGTKHKTLMPGHHVQSLAVGTTTREWQADGRSRNSKVAGVKDLQHKVLAMADRHPTVPHPSKAAGLKVLRSSKVVGQAATRQCQVGGPVVINSRVDGARAGSITREADTEDIKGQLSTHGMAF